MKYFRSKKILTAIAALPLMKRIESILARVQVALAMIIATVAVAFLCLVIIAIYFLVHLIQGR